MPRTAGIVFEPGRERARERKRDDGAVDIGVREKRLDAQTAPSGLLFVTGGISVAMMEFRGRANPSIPLKLGARSSFSTTSAAAKQYIRQRCLKNKVKKIPSAWLPMVYPPIITLSQTMGPSAEPER